MAEPTPTIAAILVGLRRGNQSGLADVIQLEIEKLDPLPGDRRRLKRDPEEDQRQAIIADEVVTSLIKAEIIEREQLRGLIREFGLEQIETIVDSGPGEGGRTIDVLTDPGPIAALKTFLETWRTEVGPLREGRTMKQ